MEIYVIALAAAVLIDTIAVVALAIIGYFERRDLYDRIMCDSIAEYKQLHSEPKKQPESRFMKIKKEWHNGTDKH